MVLREELKSRVVVRGWMEFGCRARIKSRGEGLRVSVSVVADLEE